MNKQELFEFFDKKISKMAIQQIEERHEWDAEPPEWVVVGKTARITVDDNGEIDVFVCNHADLSKGLGTLALRNRLEALKSPSARMAVELNGEGYIKTRDKQKIYDAMSLLGIRKKRTISKELVERMQNARK